MMHLVPSCSPQPPTFDASQLEFDLDLLPLVPSPSSCLSELPVSPTMFSPHDSGKEEAASPAAFSPYSPGSRSHRRLSSLDTSSSDHDLGSINLAESLLEFTQLQDRIKAEQEQQLDCSVGWPQYLQPDSTTQQQHHMDHSTIKLEPLDFLDSDGGLRPEPRQENPVLKRCLQDTSFKQKYNLKPFDFGVTTGFVRCEEGGEAEQTSLQHKPLRPTLSDVKLEPLLDLAGDLAAEQVRHDIAATATTLGIPQGE